MIDITGIPALAERLDKNFGTPDARIYDSGTAHSARAEQSGTARLTVEQKVRLARNAVIVWKRAAGRQQRTSSEPGV